MKFDVKLPGGGELHFEREPMSYERFCMICGLIALYMIGSGFLELLLSAARR